MKKKWIAAIAVAAVLLVGGACLLLLNPWETQIDVACTGWLMPEDGTAARAVPVTIQGQWRHYVWGNGEDAFLGGYDGGIFLDGERLASNLHFPDGSSAYTCLKDADRNLVLLANRKLQYILVRLPCDSADGGAMARLVVPAASQAEADAVLAVIESQPDYIAYWQDDFS